jgi:hypothetical protein
MPKKPVNLGKLIFDADKKGAAKSIPVWRVERKFKVGWRGPYRVYPYEYPGCAKVDNWFYGPDGGLIAKGCPEFNKVQRVLAACDPDMKGTDPAKDFLPKEWLKNPDKSGTKVFGFAKKSDAENWFGKKCLTALDKVGFKLREVPARKVWLSKTGKQAIFFAEDDRQVPPKPAPKKKKAK